MLTFVAAETSGGREAGGVVVLLTLQKSELAEEFITRF